MTDWPQVTVSPAHRFGAPAIKGISTVAIAGTVMAGEDVGRIAHEYDLSRHEVLLACWFEGIHGDYRKKWGRWAEAIQPKLGGWQPFDPATEPGPPDREELNAARSLTPDSRDPDVP